MKRIGTIAALCVASAQAFGLTVGDIQLQSRLNEPLRAVLDISELGPGDRRSLNVKIADAEVFAQLGLEQTAAVRGMVFELQEQGGGEMLVSMRGNVPVREPYVVLLLDIRAGEGRLLREFTVLMNPAEPVPLYAETEVPASEPPPIAAPQPQLEYRPAAVAEVPAPVIEEPVEAVAAAPLPDRGDRLDGNQPILRAGEGGAAASPPDQYGPVKAGTTLYAVATAVRPDAGVTIPQVAWALYLANPQAFDGSANALRRGATLRVPSRAAMLETPVAEARANIVGAEPVRRAAAPAPAQPDESEVAVQDATFDNFGRDPQTLPEPEPLDEPVDEGDQALAGGDAFGDEPLVEDEFSGADDAFGGADDAFADADDAFADSDDAFADADDAFADAGDQAVDDAFADDDFGADTDDAFAADDGSADTDAGGTSLSDLTSSDTALGGLPVWLIAALGGGVVLAGLLLFILSRRRSASDGEGMATPVATESVGRARPAEDPFSSTAAMTAQESDEDEQMETVSLDDAPVAEEPVPGGAAPTREFAAATDDDFAQTLAGGDTLSLDSGAATMNLDGDSEQTLQQDTLSLDGDQTAALDTSVLEESATGATPPDATVDVFEIEDEFDADKASGTGHDTISIDLSQDDPLSEADFHLAYGLYDEAELLLKGAIDADPDRLELREKLAETYFAAGNVEEFEAVAGAIKERADGSEIWQKVALLGSQIAPDSALFAGAAEGAGAVDMDFDDGLDASPSESPADGTVDFDATMAEVEPAAEPAAAAPAAGDDNVIEFDLPDDSGAEVATETAGDDAADALDTELTPADDDELAHMDQDELEVAAAEDSIHLDDDLVLDDSGDATISDDDLALEIDDEAAGELSLGDDDGAPEEDLPELDDTGLDLGDDTLSIGDDALAELSGETQAAGAEESLDLSSDTIAAEAGDMGELAMESVDLSATDLDATVTEEAMDAAAESVDLGGDALDMADVGLADGADESVDLGAESLDLGAASVDLGGEMLGEATDFGSETLNIGEDTLIEAVEASDDDAGTLNLDAISDSDPMDAKLNEARGYIEMSEMDMARSLLDEVAVRGNDDQQAEARTLLESLG